MLFSKKAFSKKAAAFLITLSLTLAAAIPANAATYTVVRNDSLYSISKIFNTSIDAIVKSNSLTSTVIYPGQAISVPAEIYTVKGGDTLYFIARKTGVTLWSLRKANNKWDDMLYIGQKLILPGGANASTGTTGTAGTGTVTGPANPVVPYTAYELDLLARLIESEAGNQPYQARVAVGAVVINRVQDSRFPNTITSVIYQKDDRFYQFTPVENGMINKPASTASRNAAIEALGGSDPTNGAIYYFDDSATNKWLWSRPLALRVDKMVYTY